MTIFFGVLLALFVFSVIVFFHELGHFLAARKTGVRVEEFWLGIPPKACVLGKDSKGTQYTLNWLPIGGFVRLKGEDAITAKDPDSFAQKGYFAKSLILLGGVAMNFLLAWILFTALFWQVTHPEGMAPIAVNAKFRTDTQTLLVPTYDQAIDRGILRVEGVLLDPIPGSPAEKSGIKTGDIVSSVQGQPIQRAREFSDAIRTHKDTSEALRFTLTHSGSTQPVQVEVIPENGKIGAYVSDNIVEYNTKIVYRFSFTDAVVHGAQETYGQAKLTLELLGNLVQKLVHPQTPTERSEATKSLTGPIGMGNLFVNLVHVNVPVSLILAIAALISINLGVFNLLPFPALDGGRFAFLTIHTVISRLSRGKMGTQKLEARANMVWFALLMLMSIFVAYQDIVRIVTGW